MKYLQKRTNKHSRLKVFLIMKLTLAFTLFFTFNLYANGFGQQKINLKAKNAEIAQVLRNIEEQTAYRFLYNSALPELNAKVTVNAQKASLDEILPLLLFNTSLTYQSMGNNLIVVKVDSAAKKDVVITGKVTGDDGTPLSGVSVQIKGMTIGTTTNSEGSFTLRTPDANVTLVLTSVGYETLEYPLNGSTNVTIALKASQQVMDQVVVVGYGTQRKIDVTGSVASVKGSEIAKQASVNVASALQGKVAGVQITNSGAPGASPQIRIRGVGTVYGSRNPLYIVDGVWFDDISFLSSGDIENISILKDASAESIYGIRAANGVVLISTKKGKTGQAATVNYNGYVGWQKVTNEVKMANANEYATIVNELSNINGSSDLLNPSDYGKGTDWYHQILRNALVNSHQISVAGGGQRSNYNLSLSYLDQDGIVEKNNFKRYTAKLQNDFQVFDFLKMGYTVTGMYSKSDDVPGGIFRQMFAAGPVVPVRYADGTYGDPNDFNLGGGNNFNPQATIDFFNQKSWNYRMNGNLFAEVKFAKNFTFRTSVGGEFGQSEVRGYTPVYTATLAQRNAISSLSGTRNETRNWILENTLTFDKKIDDHNIKVLVGQGAQRYKYYSLTATANGVPYSSDGDLYFNLGDDTTRFVRDQGDLSTIASYFGRLNYSFRNTYSLTASLRADGSSKFSDSERWGYFPSVGVGWTISNENFMKGQNIFDNLKVRGSWGKIGNASVPSNISILTVTQFPLAVYGGSTGTSNSIASIVPPVTYWERGVGTDIGLEAAFLKSRLNFEFDYYERKTEKAIFDIPILTSLGTSSSSILGNQATFQNKGVEFAVNWRDEVGEDFNYSLAANLSVNNNKVLKVSTGANPIYSGGTGLTSGAMATRTIVGQPIGHFFGYEVIGIFQDQSEIDNYKNSSGAKIQPSAKPGDFKYADRNNDGVISGLDRKVLGNPNPKYTYGINTNFNYKNFDLTLDFQGVAGIEIYNANLGWRYGNENFTKDFYDKRWHGKGTSNTYPSANIGGGDNYLPNSFFVEDGSYFRIRNMQLGYTIPNVISQKWFIKNLRIYANAQNPFNFFKYRGFSPEIIAENNSPLNSGIDANVYPLSAIYNFGVNVTF
ncbi:MAG: TonB-dependent receptor [Niabella sp.]